MADTKIDFAAWMEDVFRRKPNLTQSGLARHMGRDRAIISYMMTGLRKDLTVTELHQIASYFNEPPPWFGGRMVMQIPVAGRIGSAWYEPGTAPKSERRVAPVIEHPDVGQVAYIVDTPTMGVPDGSVVIAIVGDPRKHLRPDDLAVVRRERVGIENYTLARVGDVRESESKPVATVIEVRITP